MLTYTFWMSALAGRRPMGQVTIYLDAETEKKMKTFLQEAKISKSKWISSLIQQKTTSEWPERIKKLAGAWQDFPEVEQLRKDQGADVPREGL